jgi:hypothetical protein
MVRFITKLNLALLLGHPLLYIGRRFGEARGLYQVVLEDNFHSFLQHHGRYILVNMFPVCFKQTAEFHPRNNFHHAYLTRTNNASHSLYVFVWSEMATRLSASLTIP